ncbi:hypothetical protein F5I97DRAFT_1887978, partial [Phlebopus sp. FC_14]
ICPTLLPEDHESIDAIVAERQSQITDLTQEIKRVQTLCQKLRAVEANLKKRRSRVEASQRFHRALTSAVRRLSPEILAEIFCHCLPEYPSVPRAKDTPLVLTRVCQRWRSIAMATPQLWSSLTINLHQAAKADYRLQCDTWLARAKSVPLVLAVENDFDTSVVDTVVLDWLRGLVARCLELCWWGYLLEGLLTGSAVIGPERLDLGYFHTFLHRPTIDITCNNLRFVRLLLAAHINPIDRITLPWAQLIGLDMDGVKLRSTDIFRLFEICTRLQSARFSVTHEDDLQPEALIPGSVINRSLQRLSIAVWGSSGDGTLFDTLVLPSLEELELWNSRPDAMKWPHTQFTSFLTRSGRVLRALNVRGRKPASDHWSEYQALLPSCTFAIL